MPDKRLPVAALGLGLAGLLTGGLLALGSLVGLILALAALERARRDPARYGGRDVARAAIAANGFAVLAVVPTLFVALALHTATGGTAFEDDSLPTPRTPGFGEPEFVEAPPPPPPPPPLPGSLTSDAIAGAGAPDRRTAPRPLAPVRVGGNIREPRKLHHVSPSYPEIAKQARVQGVVILECTVSRGGAVTDVKVLRGIPLLDGAAVDAVRQWRYTPTLLEGQPVPVIMTVTVNFRLN